MVLEYWSILTRAITITRMGRYPVHAARYNTSTKVPASISPAPNDALKVKVSPRKTTESNIVNARLALSTGATKETLPDCNARK